MGDRATEVALFRYALIREAADLAITSAERGRLVRDLAARTHVGLDGSSARGALHRRSVDPGVAGGRVRGAQAQASGPLTEGAE